MQTRKAKKVFYTIKEHQVILSVKVKPNKKETKIIEVTDEHLILDLASMPVDGKANNELIQFVSKQIKCPKQDISFVMGQTWKTKTLALPKTDMCVAWVEQLEKSRTKENLLF